MKATIAWISLFAAAVAPTHSLVPKDIGSQAKGQLALHGTIKARSLLALHGTSAFRSRKAPSPDGWEDESQPKNGDHEVPKPDKSPKGADHEDPKAEQSRGHTEGEEKSWWAKPEHFSLLRLLLGPTGSCSPFTWWCGLGLAISSLLMAWTFKNLKVISDVYFVPSTISLAKRWGIPNDIAGATLLAFGSSAPEFCTNVVATFFITNESGVGDIIGSAVHNILLIIGVSAVFAGRALALWWYPLTRDSFFFALAVLELAVFLWDDHLMIWEASVLVCTYVVYCLWMFKNTAIYTSMCGLLQWPDDIPEDGDDDDDDDGEGVLWYDPIEVLWRYTTPSPKTGAFTCFMLSLVNIAWNTYLMVDAATRFGEIVGIPSLFMGLVFLAAGTSIPDAFASMAAAKKGEADMAVSNALGSNIFDILMGLGLPWLISLLIGRPIIFHGADRLLYWIFILTGVLLAFMGVVACGRFKLSFIVGVVLCGLYCVYVVWALLKSFGLVW